LAAPALALAPVADFLDLTVFVGAFAIDRLSLASRVERRASSSVDDDEGRQTRRRPAACLYKKPVIRLHF